MARDDAKLDLDGQIDLLAFPGENDTEGLALIRQLKEFICEATVKSEYLPKIKFIVFLSQLTIIRAMVKSMLGENFIDVELTTDQFNEAVKLAGTDVSLLYTIEEFNEDLEEHTEMVDIVCDLFKNNEKLLVGQYQDDNFPAFFNATPKCKEFTEQMKEFLHTPRLQQDFYEAITMTGKHLGEPPLSEGNTGPIKEFLWLNPSLTQFLCKKKQRQLISRLCEKYTDFCRPSKIKILVSDPHMIVFLRNLLNKKWVSALDDSKDEKNFRFAKEARKLGETLTALLDSEQSDALQIILNCRATSAAQKTDQLTHFFVRNDNTEIADYLCENQKSLLVLSGHYSVQVNKYYQSRNKHSLLPPDNPRPPKRQRIKLELDSEDEDEKAGHGPNK